MSSQGSPSGSWHHITASLASRVRGWLRFLKKRATAGVVVSRGLAKRAFSFVRYDSMRRLRPRRATSIWMTASSSSSEAPQGQVDGDASDTLAPEGNPVSSCPWFKNIGRAEAEEILARSSPGSFLIRPSQTSPDLLCLSICTKKRPFHVPIRAISTPCGYVIGRRRSGKHKVFKSIESIVRLYQSEPLKLETRRKTTVVYTSLRSPDLDQVQHRQLDFME